MANRISFFLQNTPQMKINRLLIIAGLLMIAPITHAKSLFNGRNLKGWYAYESETGKHANASDIFSVEENMIRLHGKKAGYLMSTKSYSNFNLTMAFRWNNDTSVERRSNKRNSGVMYLVPETTPDELWPKGIQFQVKEGATGDFILLKEVSLLINGTATIPGKSVAEKRTSDASNPIGEWNSIEIKVKDGKVIQKLNGIVVNKGSNPSVSSGRILLQYEGFPIDFKDIMIKKLK